MFKIPSVIAELSPREKVNLQYTLKIILCGICLVFAGELWIELCLLATLVLLFFLAKKDAKKYG